MSEIETIKLSASINVQSIAIVHEKLRDALHRESDLVIDLTSVTDVDASGIQLMLAANKTATENQSKLELTQPNESVKRSIATAGADRVLEIASQSQPAESQ